MGRNPIDFEPYRAQISAWFHEGLTTDEIRQAFLDKHHWKPALRTFNRTLKRWDLQKQHRVRSYGNISDELKEEFQVLFFQINSSDSKLSELLQRKGLQVSRYQVKAIRLDLGLKRRTITSEEKQQQIADIKAALAREFAKSGRLSELGRGYLHDNVLSLKGNRFPRDKLMEIYQEFFPESIHRRTWQARRQKGEFIVYGPNQVWSIDGHDKLSRWGIHIYGGIDGYSRYLTWYHVGWFGSTAISTLIQYLRVVRRLGWVPRTIRADRGKEVPLLSAAHWAFVRNGYLNEDGSDVKFGDCFYYGRSMDNTRIEHWWGQLQRSCLGRWRDLFTKMEPARLWIHDDIPSKIALLAVYMPIIRKEVEIYVDRWNKHKIRGQPNRANAVRGRPWENYFVFNPEYVSQWGLEVDVELLAEIEAVLSDEDIDQYLPPTTLQWCEAFLAGIGLDRTKEDDHNWPFVTAYNRLRTAIQIELDSGNSPGLSLAPTPCAGGLETIQKKLAHIAHFPTEDEVNNAVREAYIQREGVVDEVMDFSNAVPCMEEKEEEELVDLQGLHVKHKDESDENDFN